MIAIRSSAAGNSRSGRSMSSTAGLLAPPWPPALVDGRVDQHPAHIRVHVVVPRHPPPRGVHLHQRRLDEVLGPVHVTAHQVGDAPHPLPPLNDVVSELLIARRSSHAHTSFNWLLKKRSDRALG